MRLYCTILLLVVFVHAFAQDAREQLKVIDRYIQSDIDSAILLSKNLLQYSLDEQDHFGLVKANLYLGYFHEQRDYAKATIYYLEGIRQADMGDYQGIETDRIWLRRNLANIFRRFRANELATKYNLEAIEIASKARDTQQIIDIKFNQGLVYQNNDPNMTNKSPGGHPHQKSVD